MKLLATSVVRGSRQGESHGGVFLIDLEERVVQKVLDWNAVDIDWQGRGWDRGLRGIAFAGERIFIAASDELFVYDPHFRRVASYRNPYLKHCHEISCRGSTLFVTSTGFDSILGFDIEAAQFNWGLALRREEGRIGFGSFDPEAGLGPSATNSFHLNNVHANDQGLFISGLRTPGLLRYSGERMSLVATLPEGTHNAQPFRDGILFNDTASDVVRFVTPSRQRTFEVPAYADADLTHLEMEDGKTARRGFARGLCPLEGGLIAAGCSPSTIAIHNVDSNKSTLVVTLSRDVRNAIHGLAVWPFN